MFSGWRHCSQGPSCSIHHVQWTTRIGQRVRAVAVLTGGVGGRTRCCPSGRSAVHSRVEALLIARVAGAADGDAFM